MRKLSSDSRYGKYGIKHWIGSRIIGGGGVLVNANRYPVSLYILLVVLDLVCLLVSDTARLERGWGLRSS